MFSGSEPACFCYLHRCRPLVHRSEQDHQLVVDGQVAEDVALWHRDVPPQDLQDVVHRHWLVLIKLQTKGQRSEEISFFQNQILKKNGGKQPQRRSRGR